MLAWEGLVGDGDALAREVRLRRPRGRTDGRASSPAEGPPGPAEPARPRPHAEGSRDAESRRPVLSPRGRGPGRVTTPAGRRWWQRRRPGNPVRAPGGAAAQAD